MTHLETEVCQVPDALIDSIDIRVRVNVPECVYVRASVSNRVCVCACVCV